MPFPISVEASISLAQAPSDEAVGRVVDRIKEMLGDLRVASIAVHGSKLQFTSGFWRYRGRLQPIASGQIDVSPDKSQIAVRYRLFTLRPWEAIFMAVVFAVALWRAPTFVTLGTLTLFAAWIMISNFIAARRRFAQWLDTWLVLTAGEYRDSQAR